MATERAIFAGGCFWCMVQPFEEREGILSVISGYTGGNVENPTYEQVKKHLTGHTEAVEIIFDKSRYDFNFNDEKEIKLSNSTKIKIISIMPCKCAEKEVQYPCKNILQ